LVLFIVVGCKDKAEPDYARCVKLDLDGKVVEAWEACNAAIGESPTSESGKAAATKLAEMKPKY
jgi:hypothetical protein